jgi:regulator of replication initiation timing
MNPREGKISRKLCYIGLRNDGEAWISMCQKPSDHLVHVDGKIIEEPKGVKLSLHNGTVLSLFGQTGFAYLVEIQSSVLANKKHVLTRIDDVCTTYNMCCVCRDPYEVDSDSTSEARLPIKGTCGHDMCEECLDSNFASLLSGKQKLRYIKCPLCNEKKAFDIQNKVKDRILCDLLKARAPKATDGGNSQVIEKPPGNGSQQQFSEVAMLRKKIEELSKKNEEIENENTRLRKRVEELEKLAPENAQLKKRIEELESNPKEADQKMAESDDSDFQDDEAVEVVVLPGSAKEHDSESSSTRLETSLRRNATPPTPDTSEEQEQVDSSAPANKWACTSCTFLNMMRRKKCEVCKRRK